MCSCKMGSGGMVCSGMMCSSGVGYRGMACYTGLICIGIACCNRKVYRGLVCVWVSEWGQVCVMRRQILGDVAGTGGGGGGGVSRVVDTLVAPRILHVSSGKL